MSSHSKELEIAKKAAGKAANLIREYQQKRSFDVDFKGRNDLVTTADVEAEQVIIDVIKNVYPDDEIVAEESASDKDITEGRSWIIDPIDGTTNFVHGFPLYCVSIGFCDDGIAKVGVVLEVNSRDCFYAVAGEGAYLNDQDIKVSGVQDPQNAMIGTGFPYHKGGFTGDYLDLFEYVLHNTQSVRRPGSAAYDLCCVAAGWYDGFYEYSLKPWDIAAGALIVQEAGGKVSDWQGRDNWLQSEQLAAGNKRVHPFLLEAIRETV